MDELLNEFLTESAENISTLDVELVRLEQTPDDPELLGNIFRLVHTVKGTCGFLGLPRLEAVAHASENVLGKIRDGELSVTPEGVTLILASIDRIKDILAELEATQAEPEGDDSDLIGQLNVMASGEAVSASDAEAAPAVEPVDEPTVEPASDSGSLFDRIGGQASVDAAVEIFYGKVLGDTLLAPFFENTNVDTLRRMQSAFLSSALGSGAPYEGRDLRAAHAPLVANGLADEHFDAVAGHLQATLEELNVPGDLVAEVMAIAASTRDDVLGRGDEEAVAPVAETPVVETPVAKAAPVEAPVAKKAPAKPAAPAKDAGPAANESQRASAETSVANQTIRVGVGQLESLMTTVSELVLTRNQLLQMVRGTEDSEFKAPLQRLSHITTDLQEGVMKTRMQPIGNAWAKLPRIVRTLAHDLDKKIELEMLGSETELDRQVLELIKDPLTHMVRNSGDHGLEGPEERAEAGKSETGTIQLNAFHEGGHIVIQISDDGRGINVERVKAKVIENGLATEADLENATEQQIQQYIFRAGFSTAAEVTSVSGRGVGMDVVRTNIEQIGGTVSLSSEAGKGSVFTIKIPLTLAIVSGLIVEASGERFAIPQISVLELVRTKADSDHKIEVIQKTPVLRLRDRLLPLVSLGKTLKLESSEKTLEQIETTIGSEAFIVVTQVGSRTFGIIVDRVFDTEEIVVKPVSPILRNIDMFSGNTILGDGSVIMILDPNGIAAATGQNHIDDADLQDGSTASDAAAGEKTALLLFRAGGETPKAVPLSLVARLEEIDADTIEHADGHPVVQYRGQLMPLQPVEVGQQLSESGRQPVLVFTDRNRSMGLMVDEIVDIVEERLEFEIGTSRNGILGSAVLAGRATEILDAGHFLTLGLGDWFKADALVEGTDKQRKLLLVDDSPFFRNLLGPILTAAGYDVTVAPDAGAALQMRDEGEGFDIIVSDIEMPGMSGFDFAKACRSDGNWAETPIVALSSRTEKSDFDLGREVGFSDYVAKLDRDALISALDQTLNSVHGAAA